MSAVAQESLIGGCGCATVTMLPSTVSIRQCLAVRPIEAAAPALGRAFVVLEVTLSSRDGRVYHVREGDPASACEAVIPHVLQTELCAIGPSISSWSADVSLRNVTITM